MGLQAGPIVGSELAVASVVIPRGLEPLTSRLGNLALYPDELRDHEFLLAEVWENSNPEAGKMEFCDCLQDGSAALRPGK